MSGKVDRGSFSAQLALFPARGRTVYEALLLLSLVGILMATAVTIFFNTVTTAREVALKSELGNIRTAIRLYNVLNKRYPDSLKGMVTEEYVMSFQEEPVLKRPYLEKISIDDEGNILDPFGSLFIYTKSDGTVKSQTRGYEDW